MSLPTIVFIAPAAVCVLSWVGVGALVPQKWLAGERLLDELTRLAAGAVTVSLGLLGLGRTGLLDRRLVVVATLLLAAAGLVRCLRAPAVRLPEGRAVRLLLGLTGLALLLDVVAAAAPPTSADALKYHLALPERWLELGRIDDPFWRWEAFSPGGIDLLFGQGLALGSGEAAGVVGAAFAALAAAAVFGLGRELAGGDPLAGAVGAAAFVCQGIVTWEATSNFVELGVVFFACLAGWHALRAVATRTGALWAGALAGAAAGSKYLGLLAAAVVLVPLLAYLLRRRRSRDAALCAGLAALTPMAWYLKNAVATGNPVYPLFYGGRHWPDRLDATLQGLHDAYGTGSILRLPLLPIDLLVHSDAFDRGRYVGTAVFVLGALALVFRRPATTLVLAACAAYLVGWWLTSAQARFLLPALAGLAAAGAGPAAGLLRGSRTGRVAVIALLGAATVAWLAPSVALTRQLIPVTLGLEDRASFVQRLTGTHDAFASVAGRVDGTLGIAFEQIYTYPEDAISLGAPFFRHDVDEATYLRRLRSLGVRYVLVPAATQEVLTPVRSCLSRGERFPARFVTSRSRGESIPLPLVLYALERQCAL